MFLKNKALEQLKEMLERDEIRFPRLKHPFQHGFITKEEHDAQVKEALAIDFGELDDVIS